MRPWIAIVGELADETKPELVLPLRYADAVERAGGAPFAVPFPREAESLARIVERADGLLFSGADDFDTQRLGLGPLHPRAKPVPARKQDFDLALARRALEEGLPTLGICYGMQLLALVEGGKLLQHLPDDRPGCQEHAGGVRHAVRVLSGTKLRAIVGVASLEVVSRHHQGVARAGVGWVVSGTDEQGLIEAIEREGQPFALGVQWHPELSLQDHSGAPHARIFAALVEAACERARSRSSAEAPT